jgi:hypothetical protein
MRIPTFGGWRQHLGGEAIAIPGPQWKTIDSAYLDRGTSSESWLSSRPLKQDLGQSVNWRLLTTAQAEPTSLRTGDHRESRRAPSHADPYIKLEIHSGIRGGYWTVET